MLQCVKDVPGCANCPMARLFPNRTFVAPKIGTGTITAIAESPGEEEDLQGKPLVGGSGKWWDGFLRRAKIDRNTVTELNCIQCRPPDNIFPTDNEARKYISKSDGEAAVSQCLANHVWPLLESRKHSKIFLLGAKPLQLIAEREGGIHQWRGSPISIPRLGPNPIAIPTFHPAYIMREQRMIPVVVNDLKKTPICPPENYLIYPTHEQVKEFVESSPTFCFDIETNMWTREPTMIGLSKTPYHAILVPFKGEYIKLLRQLFANATECIGHNLIQFDLPILQEKASIYLNPDAQIWDTMLMQHLVQPDLDHDLEFVSSIFTNKPAWKEQHRGEAGYWEQRCVRDTDATLQIYTYLRALLRQYKLEDLYKAVQVPLARICYLMHTTGIKINGAKIGEFRQEVLGEMEKLEKDLPDSLKTHQKKIRRRIPAPAGTLGKSGKPIKFSLVEDTETVTPWRSDKTVGEYLYSELQLPVQTHVKTDRVTTDKRALERLYTKTKSPAIRAIQRLRSLDELITTFAKEDMSKMDYAYPHFNVHGTASGRLSSSEPNLQNIPTTARIIYVPSHEGWKLVECDFSQIENRLTAWFANDLDRLSRFIKDPAFSEHKFAASLFFGIPYEKIEKDNNPHAPYNKAKHIVHGNNYGMGPKRISKEYDLDYREVVRLLNIWKQTIGKTTEWQNLCAEQARRDGYLTTPFGRKRWFYTLSYYTEALSFLPQSTAADIIYRAMIGLMYNRIGWSATKADAVVSVLYPLPVPAKLLLQVHDSLLFECPAEQVEELIRIVGQVMQQPWKELGGFSIPIAAKVGDTWKTVE